MPTWFGPVIAATVTVTLSMLGAFSWLIRHFIESAIERGIRKAVDRLERESNDRVSKIERELIALQTQRQGDIELTNVKLGQIRNDHDRHERQSDQRFSDLERIVGRARSLIEGRKE